MEMFPVCRYERPDLLRLVGRRIFNGTQRSQAQHFEFDDVLRPPCALLVLIKDLVIPSTMGDHGCRPYDDCESG